MQRFDFHHAMHISLGDIEFEQETLGFYRLIVHRVPLSRHSLARIEFFYPYFLPTGTK